MYQFVSHDFMHRLGTALGKLPGPGSNIQPQALKIGRLRLLPDPDSFLRVSTTEV
jgi:hypothetical protein